MTLQIQEFTHECFGKIRTLMMADGQVGFIGKDVAEILGYKNPCNAIRKHVEEEDKTTHPFRVTGSNYKTQAIFITESGLYALILSSKMPQAREFKHWVTSEVLPQIRQTGGYIPTTEADDDASIMARALLVAQRTIDQQQRQIKAQQPLVRFAQAVTSSDGSILIRDLAKLITQNGVPIGQARLFYWLRLHGYLFQNETRPIQKWVEKGLFDTNVTIVDGLHGTHENLTTRVTTRGQQYFLDGFLSGRFRYRNGEL